MRNLLQKEEKKMAASRDRTMDELVLELTDIDSGDDTLEIMMGGDTQVDIHDFDPSNDDEFALSYLDSLIGGD